MLSLLAPYSLQSPICFYHLTFLFCGSIYKVSQNEDVIVGLKVCQTTNERISLFVNNIVNGHGL